MVVCYVTALRTPLNPPQNLKPVDDIKYKQATCLSDQQDNGGSVSEGYKGGETIRQDGQIIKSWL